MLDVHPPEHAINGTRDLFVHLATITLGLLIALALENAAEALHHRHQRHEAEAMIRQELRENLDTIKQGTPVVMAEFANMRKLLVYVQARSQGQDADPGGISLVFHEGPMQDSAWRTASSTGALSYMDYAEVQQFSAAYKEQDLLQGTEEAALDDYLELGGFVKDTAGPGALSKEDATAALPCVRRTLAHLSGMIAIGNGTVASYNEALK